MVALVLTQLVQVVVLYLDLQINMLTFKFLRCCLSVPA